MNTDESFSDLSHIEHIRRHLWCGREYGRAAIMVGSGFSFNSEKSTPHAPGFPSWADLAGHLFDSLYPEGSLPESDRVSKRQQTLSGAGTLRLASEYESTFMRPSLDSTLRGLIPDAIHVPGELHELLLNLPWSDVFTTNYDTLLERTRDRIAERKFDLVLDVQDIPGSMKPRIIKLHGSVPSNRPFILTEEDYRTYPTRFAPFVNMVEQALMENIFCLIGFSGDDPNFLHWIGWVRDNLKEATPPIYLCGLLNLSSSQRKLLESKRIVPVDLSPLFPKMKYQDENRRHKDALKWFLKTLRAGKPPNLITRWPGNETLKIFSNDPNLPPIPPGPHQMVDPGEMYPDYRAPVDSIELESILKTWEAKRKEYPGWIIAPEKNAQALWKYTEHWIDRVFSSFKLLETSKDFELVYELLWRLEICGTSMESRWLAQATELVEKYHKILFEPDLIGTTNPKKKELLEKWVWVIFFLIRYHSHNLDLIQFEKLMKIAKSATESHADFLSQWHYEKVLFALFSCDEVSAKILIDQWNENNESPYWTARRAALLAQLGEIENAYNLAETALNNIRKQIPNSTHNCSLLSQEGWLILFIGMLKNARSDRSEKNEYEERQARFEQLEIDRCNPWTVIDSVRQTVSGPPPQPRPLKETVKRFDPGAYSITQRSDIGLSTADFIPAFAALKLHEKAGVPLNIDSHFLAIDIVSAAIGWIIEIRPIWAISRMIHSGDLKIIDEWLTRARVITLPKEDVVNLSRILLLSTTNTILLIKNTQPSSQKQLLSFSVSMLPACIEVLSRLSVQMTKDHLTDLFQLALQCYDAAFFRKNPEKMKILKALFKRIFTAVDQVTLKNFLPSLLKLNLFGGENAPNNFAEDWPEPLEHFAAAYREDSLIEATETIRSNFSDLIQIALHSDKLRERAIRRMYALTKVINFSAQEINLFSQAVWSHSDSVTLFPKTGLRKEILLNIPSNTENQKPKELIKEYLLRVAIPTITMVSDRDGKKYYSYFNRQHSEWVSLLRNSTYSFLSQISKEKGINWNKEEALQIFRKTMEWWNKEKLLFESLTPSSFFTLEDLTYYTTELLKVLTSSVISTLDLSVEDANKNFESFIKTLSEMNIPTYALLPLQLKLMSKDPTTVEQELITALKSSNEQIVDEAILSICIWIFFESDNRNIIPKPREKVINELIRKVVYRREPSLPQAITKLARLIKMFPDYFSELQIGEIALSIFWLVRDTTLNPSKSFVPSPLESYSIPNDIRPDYRLYTAILLKEVLEYMKKNTMPISEELLDLERNLKIDLLPEISSLFIGSQFN